MKCKIGDICRVIISEFPENINKLMTVKAHSAVPGEDWDCEALQPVYSRNTKTKRVELWPAGTSTCCEDRQIVPLHDGDGVDETFEWAGKPVYKKQKETVLKKNLMQQ